MKLKNAALHTMEGIDYENGWMAAENGVITGIGPMEACPEHEGEEWVDLKGAHVYPGFIDAHTHLGMWEDGLTFEGDDGNLDNKALLYLAGKRQYFMDRPEYIKLNLERSRNDEARYDHVIADSIKNDISITKVEPGDITVVKGDGTITDNVSGLMFNEDGYKTFAHSNGKDSIYVYPKMTSGEYNGKFVQNNVVGRGYLDKSRYGENVLLITYMEPATPNEYATQEHYIDVEGLTMDVDQLKDMAEEKVIIED